MTLVDRIVRRIMPETVRKEDEYLARREEARLLRELRWREMVVFLGDDKSNTPEEVQAQCR